MTDFDYRPSNEPEQVLFNPPQLQLFASLSSAMRFVGIGLMIMGGFSILGAAFAGLVLVAKDPIAGLIGGGMYVVIGLVYVMLGIWSNNGATAFGQVGHGPQRDMSSLMQGIENLKSIYSLLRVMIAITLVLACCMVPALAAITVIGTNASTQFSKVGSSIGAPRR
jgi:hypothetical protein